MMGRISKKMSVMSLSNKDSEVFSIVGPRVGHISKRGNGRWKNRNEDRVSSLLNESDELIRDSVLTAIVAVYDGHGGLRCVDYIQKNLLLRICAAFPDNEAWKEGEEKLVHIFESLDKEFCEAATAVDDNSGACATIVIVKDNEALVANVGDCKAVLCGSDGRVRRITADHRAGVPAENRRVTDAGGSVYRGRVLSVDRSQSVTSLEPSRTFGDADAKRFAGVGVIIPTPYTSRISIAPGDIFIVATDGLWDVVSSEGAAKLCKRALRKSRYDPDHASKTLANKAIVNRSSDDISIAVLIV